MDARRRQYVPLYVYVAQSNTGQRLQDRYGNDGLLVWVLFLAACKAGFNQGEFEYASEEEGWRKLGLTHAPAFTLKEFFAYTGRYLRLTSLVRSGAVFVVKSRTWDAWNTEVRRQQDSDKKRRKRGRSTGDNTATKRRRYDDIRGTELEVDSEENAPAHARIKGPHAGATSEDPDWVANRAAVAKLKAELAERLGSKA